MKCLFPTVNFIRNITEFNWLSAKSTINRKKKLENIRQTLKSAINKYFFEFP